MRKSSLHQFRSLRFTALLVGLLPLSASADDAFQDDILPLVQNACFDCHGGGESYGDVDLQAFTGLDQVVGEIQLWENVAAVIEHGEMPPEDAEPMSDQDRERVVAWIRELIRQTNAAGQTDVDPIAPRRLTRREYVNTVQDLLGVTIDAETFLPEDKVGATGFRNDATELMIPAELLEKYLMLAEKVVAEAIERDEDASSPRLLLQRPKGKGDHVAAAERIVRQFGRRAFRRPLSDAEVDQYVGLYRKVAGKPADFQSGVSVIAKAMLVSPHFLFRIERAAPEDGVVSVDEFEFASRLSYLIWSSMPDDELLRLAEEGRLSQPKVVQQQVQRMLADPRAMALAEEFVDQWLFSHVTLREPDLVIFPEYTPELAESMRVELNRFIVELFREDRSLVELIDSRYTFVNQTLAEHYGIDGVQGEQFQRVGLESYDHRGGLLGMAHVLQRTSMADRTSPTVRGAWVLDAILGTPPPPPPPNVNNTISQSDQGTSRPLSFREKLDLHANDGNSCSSCHKKMDPIGFALDNYDGIGRWRETENGVPLDTTGTLSSGRQLTGVSDLKGMLLDRKEQVVGNVVRRFLTYALGRELTGRDYPSVQKIVSQVAEEDYRASAMVNAVVQSYPFRHKKHPAAVADTSEQP